MMLYLLISFLASAAGAICGIGGGVLIKPVLDLLQMGSAATISFLSGCTVLAMSSCSVGQSVLAREHRVQPRIGTPLALGAALGGIAGKQLFTSIKSASGDPDLVGAIQAGCLAAITAGTLLYTVKRSTIRTHELRDPIACAGIGATMGLFSSFLGIGGGPINLSVLHYCFSMDTKTAAANSLYVILFSQAASLAASIATHTIPPFSPVDLMYMVVGGIAGGIAGRAWSKRMDDRTVDKLFIFLMAVIIGISIWNTFRCL